MKENALTLFEKIWRQHRVAELGDNTALVHIDRVFLHERTGSVALDALRHGGRSVRNPELVFCTMDHIVDTFPGRGDATRMPGGDVFIKSTRESARREGIRLFDVTDPGQGIVHVISPEQGIALPGATVVCPDSHTCTQGALGALAWGIGSSEAEHALATQTLRVKKPRTMQVTFDGIAGAGVTAKDLMLYLIATYTAAGGSGYMLEFDGSAVRALDIEARLTLCNLAVEFSAFSGIIAPDDKVFEYVAGRPFAPQREHWNSALAQWHSLHSDEGASFDRTLRVNAADISPMVTWGNSPQHGVAVSGVVPDPAQAGDAAQRQSMERALTYMGLTPGQKLADLAIDAAFIGSCTNARLSDLRLAASILKGRRVAPGVKAICVPGSSQVKRDAEAEGLDKVFREAGFEWRESGCSMCFYAGGESFGFRERVVSTTNRNFESRQGPETRSHLASPATVAASAVMGRITDPRTLSGN
jgi:3-isopropylmalate/(R)-2-methylmalate dehydratase large subunit